MHCTTMRCTRPQLQLQLLLELLLQGILGEKLADYMAAEGGLITLDDLKYYSIAERYVSDAEQWTTLDHHSRLCYHSLQP